MNTTTGALGYLKDLVDYDPLHTEGGIALFT